MKKLLLLVLFCVTLSFEGISQTQPFTVTVNLDGQVIITNTSSGWSQWELEYGPVGFTPGSGTTISNITTSSRTLIINPFLSYDIRTRNKVNSYVFPWSNIYTYSNCEDLYPVEYTTDFETSPASDCWRGYSTPVNSSNILITPQTLTSGNATVKIQIQGTTTGTGFLVAPKFEGMGTDKKIKFTLYGYSGNGLSVGTLSNPYDPATFTLLETIVPTSSVYMQHYTIDLTNYNGTDQYIAFRLQASTSSTSNIVNIDNFSFQQYCDPVSDFTISNIAENSVQLNFTSDEQTLWEASVRRISQTNGEIVSVTGTPFIINNLLSDEPYEIKLRSVCSSINQSDWSAPINFTTVCTPMVPGYTTSFDTPLLDPCWQALTTPPASVNPVDETNVGGDISPRTGAKMIKMSNWSGTTNHVYLISRYVENITTNNRISFYLVSKGANTNFNQSPLIIGTMSDPADINTFVPLKTISPSEMSEIQGHFSYDWKKHFITFEDYDISNNHHYIAFKHGNGAGGDAFYIDDFTYENIPACLEPLNPVAANATHDTVEITWENAFGSSSTEWQVEYGPDGFALGTGTILTVTTPFTTLTGLPADDTEYDFYVRAKCGNDWSMPSDKGQFRTECFGVEPGYTYGFESDPVTSLNTCWTRLTPVGNDNFYIPRTFISVVETGTSWGYPAHGGTQSVRMHNETNAPIANVSDKIILVTPRLIDFDSYKTISFWMYCQSSGYATPEEIVVGTLSDPNDYSTFTPFYSITDGGQNLDQWKEYNIGFESYTGTDQYVGIKQIFDNDRQVIFIDDFTYGDISCPIPTDLYVQQTSATEYAISWTNNIGTASPQWEIEFDGTVTSTTTNSMVVDNLEPGNYTFRVRNICQSGAGEWSEYYNINVSNCPATAPLYENFDSYDPIMLDNFCWFLSSWANLTSYCIEERMSCPYSIELSGDYTVTDPDANAMIVSPYLIDFDNNKKIRFYAYQPYFGYELTIGTMLNPNDPSTFETYTTVQIDPNAIYGKEYEVDFSGYTGNAKHIAIRFEAPIDMGTTRIYIDDIYYLENTDCDEPLNAKAININSNSAVISWEAVSSAESFIIEYGHEGFTPGTGTVITATGTEQLINGLTPQTHYEFYIKSSCAEGIFSYIIGPKVFITTCVETAVPWLETFDSLPQYGDNQITECFKPLFGTITSYNTAIPGWDADGADDSFYLHSYDYVNKLLSPIFHLTAGTTYTFSFDGRKAPWTAYSATVKVGRGHAEHVMFTDLSAEGTLPENGQFNTIKYHFTPLVSGDYSFLFRYIGANSGGLVADRFQLLEGYTATINEPGQVYGFESEIPEEIIVEGTENTTIIVVQDGEDNALEMQGGTSDEGWVIIDNTAGRNVNTNNDGDIWMSNENFITKANFKVDATSMQSLQLSFKLRQTYNTINTESQFRVIINGEVIDEILPQTSNGDQFITHTYNLAEYLGTHVRVSLQHIGRRNTNFGELTGDNAYLDDIELTGTSLSVNGNLKGNAILHPNPVNDELNIEYNDIITNIELYNVSGQLLNSLTPDSQKVRLSMKNYQQGIYFVKVCSGKHNTIYKIIKN